MRLIRCQSGYTLIELVLVLIIIGVMASIASKSLSKVTDVARTEETKQEMERLANAIVGNLELTTGGIRTDYGYVGDIGALPPNLDALVQNPGGYSAWRGPYISDDFSTDGSTTEYKNDAWGKAYTYSGSASIISSGGSTTLTRNLANSVSDLLYNRITVVVVDLDGTPPGNVYKDSVRFLLTYPNGTGGLQTDWRNPGRDGLAVFDSIPIGIHELRLVYISTADTLLRKVALSPGVDYFTEISLFENYWSGS